MSRWWPFAAAVLSALTATVFLLHWFGVIAQDQRRREESIKRREAAVGRWEASLQIWSEELELVDELGVARAREMRAAALLDRALGFPPSQPDETSV